MESHKKIDRIYKIHKILVETKFSHPRVMISFFNPVNHVNLVKFLYICNPESFLTVRKPSVFLLLIPPDFVFPPLIRGDKKGDQMTESNICKKIYGIPYRFNIT